MTRALGIIGTGLIGAAVARLAVGAGLEVVLANSRGPESLDELVAELGPLASAGTVEQAAAAGPIVVLSVPLLAVEVIGSQYLRGKVVIDTSNYYPFRDGRVAVLDAEEVTTSELIATWLPGVRLVKAFNNIMYSHICELARVNGAPDRSALPIASDDQAAKADAANLIELIGFDTCDAGSLAESWRFEPESTAYTSLYFEDPSVPMEKMLEAATRTVPRQTLRAPLASSRRVAVAKRTF